MKVFCTRQAMTVAVLLAASMSADRSVTHADEPALPLTTEQRTGRSPLELADAEPGRFFGSSSPTWIQRIGIAGPQIKSLDETRASSVKPQTKAESPASDESSVNQHGRRVDGTWREENGFVIINLNGQELRLAKSGSKTTKQRVLVEQPVERQRIVPAAFSTDSETLTLDRTPEPPVGGTVDGRLLHRGQAVSECQVSLIPLRKSFGGYEVDERAEPQKATTTADGRYRFTNVPRGSYKLFWLPKGERQWVRRIEYKPDVQVQTGEETRIKDIRTALRTLN